MFDSMSKKPKLYNKKNVKNNDDKSMAKQSLTFSLEYESFEKQTDIFCFMEALRCCTSHSVTYVG
jgi:hypothetical protein